jgi:hypothetical protein
LYKIEFIRQQYIFIDGKSKCYVPEYTLHIKKGLTICHSNEIVQSHFLDGVLIVRYINKMVTNGGGGVVDGVTLRRLQAILVPG